MTVPRRLGLDKHQSAVINAMIEVFETSGRS